MKIQITARWSNAIKFECELEAEWESRTLRAQRGEAIRRALKSGSDLSGSDLRGSDLRGSDLRGSNLSGSNLSGSDLRGSDLRDSNLSGSDLRGSDLRDSNLSGSDLRDSDLSDSNLRDSNLSGSNLSGSDLRGSDLRDSNLSDSNLRGSDLTPIRDDLWAVLSAAPAEVQALRSALADGRVDGSTYQGECACLVGTIANARHTNYNDLGVLKPNSSRLAEVFFLNIKKGDTPETNQVSKIALEWTDEWLTNMRAAFGSSPETTEAGLSAAQSNSHVS